MYTTSNSLPLAAWMVDSDTGLKGVAVPLLPLPPPRAESCGRGHRADMPVRRCPKIRRRAGRCLQHLLAQAYPAHCLPQLFAGPRACLGPYALTTTFHQLPATSVQPMPNSTAARSPTPLATFPRLHPPTCSMLGSEDNTSAM